MEDWDCQPDRLQRIRDGHRKDASARQLLVADLIERCVGEPVKRVVPIVQGICDGWLLSESEIISVLLNSSGVISKRDLVSRVEELQVIDSASALAFGDDLVAKTRWLRSACPELGGFSPLEYIRGAWGDANRVAQTIPREEEN